MRILSESFEYIDDTDVLSTDFTGRIPSSFLLSPVPVHLLEINILFHDLPEGFSYVCLFRAALSLTIESKGKSNVFLFNDYVYFHKETGV